MSPIPQRNLGGDATSVSVGAIGHGLMLLTWTPSPVSDEVAFASMKAAADAGATFWNSGQFYNQPDQPLAGLKLLNRFFERYPEYADRITLSVKGGMGPGGLMEGPNSSLENLRRDLKEILEALGTRKSVDIYEPARVDPSRTIEEATKNLATLQKEGLFKHIGLSEIHSSALRKAHAVAPIAAVEIELSLWIEPESLEVVKVCKELDIAVIAYSPLGRGMLTGKFKSNDDLEEGDMRKNSPRFQPDVFDENLKIVDALNKMASKKGCTPAQLALAYLLTFTDKVIPIPGSSSAERVRENIESANLTLTSEEEQELNDLVQNNKAIGSRYPEHHSGYNFGTGKLE